MIFPYPYIVYSFFFIDCLAFHSEKAMAPHSHTLAWRIPMDREAWKATVHAITKSWTCLSDKAQHSTAKALRNIYLFVP